MLNPSSLTQSLHLDGWMTCNFTSLNNISVFLANGNEILRAMEPHLQLRRLPSLSGIEPATLEQQATA